MKAGRIGKMTTALIILVLIASGLLVVQWNAQPIEATEIEDEMELYTIDGFLDDSEGEEPIEDDLEIKLRNLKTGDIDQAQTDGDYFEFSDQRPGWYEIILPSQIKEGTSYMRTVNGPFEVIDDTSRYMEVDLEVDHQIVSGTIIDEDGEKLEQVVEITFENEDFDFTKSTHTEIKEIDGENQTYFEAEIYEGFTGWMRVEKEGYTPHLEELEDFDGLVDSFEFQIGDEITKRPVLQGRLYDEETERGIREELDVTLFDKDTGLIYQETENGPSFTIRAPEGDYILVIDSPDYAPYVEEITLEGFVSRESEVEKEGPEEFTTEIDMGDDPETLTVTNTRQLLSSTRMETMDYTDIGLLGMQINMALGARDGYVGDEIDEFEDRLEYNLADVKTTGDLIMVDGIFYEIEDDEFSLDVDLGDLEGDVTALNEEIEVEATIEYSAVEEIEENLDSYQFDLILQNDHIYGNYREFTYELILMEGYERYLDSEDEVIPPNVDVEGHTVLEIDPKEDGTESQVTFDVRRSEEGEVNIIMPDVRGVMEIDDDDIDYEYVLKEGNEFEIGADYESETSSAISFDWYWRGQHIGEDEEIEYAFDEPGEGELEVEVEDSAGFEYEASVDLMIDGEAPTGDHIIVNEEEVEVGDETYVNETEEIEFSAIDFEDELTGIGNYKWNFSDDADIIEGSDEMNVTHEYEIPGYYEVSLNVTDGVGNEEKYQIGLIVNDTSEPVGDFTMEWDEESSDDDIFIELEQDKEVFFDASEITPHEEEYDHPDYQYNITSYEWEIKELNEQGEGVNWTYDFTEESPGEYTIILNVTDAAGNLRTIEKTIEIEGEPVPDLRVTDLTFSEDSVRVGESVKISVNVTNLEEDAIAEEVITELEIEGDMLDIDEVFYDEDGDERDNETIGGGETVMIEMEWEPEEEGDKTVNVTVYDTSVPEDRRLDDTVSGTFTVDPPVWREYLVYALIPIILIGITVGLYLYKDRISQVLK